MSLVIGAGLDVDVAVATVTPKSPGSSQDRVGTFRVPARGRAGVVVADGVGEFAGSGPVAEQAVSTAVDELSQDNGMIPDESLVTAVNDAAASLSGQGATTLIAIEAAPTGRVDFAYVGNGAVLEVAGSSLGGARTRLLFVNHMLPQIGMGDGRLALAGYLPRPAASLRVGGGHIAVTQDTTRLFLAVTDGLMSEEERRVGHSTDGSVWAEIPAPLAILLNAIEASWPILTGGEAQLETVLRQALEDALTAGALEDDASVGAVLLHPAGVGGQG